MTNTSLSRWEELRTEETRAIEDELSRHFEKADAYRYNSASIRVRVVDSRFEGIPIDERDALVEPLLEKLPQQTQADILYLLTVAPSEIEQPARGRTFREYLQNMEFEDPTPSTL